MAANGNHPPLCAKGCGFYGSKETKNLCSKCNKDFLKVEISKWENKVMELPVSVDLSSSTSAATEAAAAPVKKTNRCQCCNKKVRLMGFWCRCGHVFCGLHRYPTEHSCTFDFKTADRVVLSEDNPVINPDKLDSRI